MKGAVSILLVTLTLDLPQINDGEYEIKAVSGKEEDYITFQSRRISFAARTENRGICVYAADYETGEPIRKADIELRKSGKTVSVYKDFNFKGFYASSCGNCEADGRPFTLYDGVQIHRGKWVSS